MHTILNYICFRKLKAIMQSQCQSKSQALSIISGISLSCHSTSRPSLNNPPTHLSSTVYSWLKTTSISWKYNQIPYWFSIPKFQAILAVIYNAYRPNNLAVHWGRQVITIRFLKRVPKRLAGLWRPYPATPGCIGNQDIDEDSFFFNNLRVLECKFQRNTIGKEW